MQVKCLDCNWNGDSDDGQTSDFSENPHGVKTQEVTCPECGGELTEA